MKLPRQFFANQIVEKFKDIENKHEFPQDIEWCIKDNQFYLLQTRPITTITHKQYEQVNFLEKKLFYNLCYSLANPYKMTFLKLFKNFEDLILQDLM